MPDNVPTEVELLRRVASAASWLIEANGDDPVGRDGRSKVGINWVLAAGTLNQALKALREHYSIPDAFEAERAKARNVSNRLVP